MNSAFTTFRQFDTVEEAEAVLVRLLDRAGIAHEVAPEYPPVLAGFRDENPTEKIAVRLNRADFQKVQNLLVWQAVEATMGETEPDHYLFSFTTDELVEVVKKPDEWSAYDVTLTRHILHHRGITVNNDHMNALVRERIRTLAEHDKPSPFWLATGFVLAVLGGLGGILFGLQYVNDTKKLPTGQKVYTYDEATRRKGKRMLLIGGVVFGALVLTGLYFLLDLAVEKWD